LTLTASGCDLAPDTYHVSVTETDKSESARLALTVTPYFPVRITIDNSESTGYDTEALAIASLAEKINDIAKGGSQNDPVTAAISGINISNYWGNINTALSGVTKYMSIDISGCTATDNTISGSSAPIGNEMNIIENSLYISQIILPSSLTSIGANAFYNCRGLTSIIIPSSVTSIGVLAFWNCIGLTSVTIPNSVTSIGNHTFYNCRGLISVTIPDSITSIGKEAFYSCIGLTSVTIPNSVTSIGTSAFYLCSGLTSVTIPNSVTSIGSSTFYLCSGLTSVTIPSGVTSIGNSAFESCRGLTSITIPSSVTSIGSNAFSRCNGLTSVTIPKSVTSIGNYAFSGCSGLTSVTFAADSAITSFGSLAFPEGTSTGDALKTAYTSGGAGTYTRDPSGSVWTKTK
jgi:hypothetical protein